jgi:hypothetical protein
MSMIIQIRSEQLKEQRAIPQYPFHRGLPSRRREVCVTYHCPVVIHPLPGELECHQSGNLGFVSGEVLE